MKTNYIKMISAIAAVTMCIATGCGSIDDAAPTAAAAPETTETTAAETKIEETEAAPTEATAETSGQADMKPIVSEKASIFNDDNCIIIPDEGNCDKAALYHMAELALEQYDLIAARDKQGYFDSLNIPALLANEKTIAMLTAGAENDTYEPEYDLLSAALMLSSPAVSEEEATLFEGRPDGMDAAEYENKLRVAVGLAAKNISPENASELFEDYAPFNAFFGSESDYYLPEGFTATAESLSLTPDDETKYMISSSDYTVSESGAFAYVGVAVMKGDYIFTIEAEELITDKGETSVIITDMEIEENEYKGMALKDIMDKYLSLARLKTLNANAKTGYNIAAEYFCDQEIAGKSLDEVFKSDSFKLITSPEGLDLGNSAAEHGEGDERFFEVFNDCEITEGTFCLGKMKRDGEDTFFIQFKTDDSGIIGQYPDCITEENAGKVVWGKYFSSEETSPETVQGANTEE